jgi:hypothetical protein
MTGARLLTEGDRGREAEARTRVEELPRSYRIRGGASVRGKGHVVVRLRPCHAMPPSDHRLRPSCRPSVLKPAKDEDLIVARSLKEVWCRKHCYTSNMLSDEAHHGKWRVLRGGEVAQPPKKKHLEAWYHTNNTHQLTRGWYGGRYFDWSCAKTSAAPSL